MSVRKWVDINMPFSLEPQAYSMGR